MSDLSIDRNILRGYNQLISESHMSLQDKHIYSALLKAYLAGSMAKDNNINIPVILDEQTENILRDAYNVGFYNGDLKTVFHKYRDMITEVHPQVDQAADDKHVVTSTWKPRPIHRTFVDHSSDSIDEL